MLKLNSFFSSRPQRGQKCGKWERALSLLAEMCERGVAPDKSLLFYGVVESSSSPRRRRPHPITYLP